MEELSIEEKAKAYDEALAKAKELYSQHCAEWRDEDLELIFPELKESQDEKIRKELLVFCRTLATGRTSVLANNIDFNKWISWLEKQNQKPIKSGEWDINEFRTWQYIVSDVLTKWNGIGQYLDGGEYRTIAKKMQEEWSKKLA
jgi:hypothetical protein